MGGCTASQAFGLSVATERARVGFRLSDLRADGGKRLTSMDPRLQMTVRQARIGMPRVAMAAASAQEVSVIARVKDVARWEALSEVRVGAAIGQSDAGDFIVTGRVPVRRIEAVRTHENVVSLKAAQHVRPALDATTRETGAAPMLLPSGTKPGGGAGVVVGVVDFGCDFAHANFRNADGSTRIEAIWHQAASGASSGPHGYGLVHRGAAIDAALGSADPYAALHYGPEHDSPQMKGSHGTHVMDIAAGNGNGSGVAGCAPRASLVFVELAATDVAWTGAEAVGSTFGDSVRLLEAVKFVFDEAGERPCVVNLSLGTNGGPHDGTTLVEQGLDALVREKPNRAVVIAASNSHEDGIHAAGTVPANGSLDLEWVQAGSNTPAELEVWVPGAQRVAVELVAPDGSSIDTIEPNDSREFADGNDVLIFVANRVNDPSNGDNMIGVFLAGAFPAGTWRVRLHGRGTDAAIHAWIERFDSAQSSFAPPHDNSHTLGSISCGWETIVVGSYDAHKASVPLSWFSSEGPTRDGRDKPELSAPGHDVQAAWSRTGTAVTRKSGTSMAAPAVTGIVALLFAEARRVGRDLSSAELRAQLLAHARSNPPPAGGWDARYGHGRVSADAVG